MTGSRRARTAPTTIPHTTVASAPAAITSQPVRNTGWCVPAAASPDSSREIPNTAPICRAHVPTALPVA